MELNQAQVDALYLCIKRVRNSGYEGPPEFGMDKPGLIALQALMRPAMLGRVAVALQGNAPVATVMSDELFE